MSRQLSAKADSADFVQDTLVKFLRHGPKFVIENEGQFRALLLRVAENAMHDNFDKFAAARRAQDRESPLSAGSVLFLDRASRGLGETTSTPSRRAQRNEDVALVRMALEILDADARQVLVMRD